MLPVEIMNLDSWYITFFSTFLPCKSAIDTRPIKGPPKTPYEKEKWYRGAEGGPKLWPHHTEKRELTIFHSLDAQELLVHSFMKLGRDTNIWGRHNDSIIFWKPSRFSILKQLLFKSGSLWAEIPQDHNGSRKKIELHI